MPVVLALLTISVLAPAKAPAPLHVHHSEVACPKMPARPIVYGIGSSTMRGTMGPMFKRIIRQRKYGLSFTNYAKSSTGLARPDFFDWHTRVKELTAERRPHLWVVSLGTNDYQAVRIAKRKWLRPPTKAWEEAYAARVRGLLELMSGPKRKSAVVYLGSTAFNRPSSRRIGPKLNAIIQREIEKFDGPAVFYNAFAATTNKKNEPLAHASTAAKRGFKVYGPDGVHLTRTGVQQLLAEPALRLLRDCAGQK